MGTDIDAMDSDHQSLFSRAFQAPLRIGFRRAYPRVQVDAEKFLHHARRAYNLPIESWRDIHSLDEQMVLPAAEKIIWSSARMAALEGMGLGLGGLATMLPDMGILAAITIRMLQKLSLIYGFEYSTPEEVGGLWLAAASAAGLDFTREFVEKAGPRTSRAANCRCHGGEGGGGSGGEVGRARDSPVKRRRRGNSELLLRSFLGSARATPFP